VLNRKSKRYARQQSLVKLGLVVVLAFIFVPLSIAIRRSTSVSYENSNNPHGDAKHEQQKTPVSIVSPIPDSKTTKTEPSPPPLSVNISQKWLSLPLYVDPLNKAVAYYKDNPNVDGANLIGKEGQTPIASWFGDWDLDVQSDANDYVTSATQSNSVPVLVLYNIPKRDCGLYSAGGAKSESAYLSWVQNTSKGIGGRLAVVILEPDALAGMDCLNKADQQIRSNLLLQAVKILKANSNTAVYIDAGNPSWQTADLMAERLKNVGVAQADGFSLNVSNYVSTANNQNYGDQISKQIGYRHYVIDTSRNGNDQVSPSDWCNSPKGALGKVPSITTGNPLNDGLLWIKPPWESDGSCNGSPAAGSEYWSFAILLAKNAGWK
jgi:endoglucanase